MAQPTPASGHPDSAAPVVSAEPESHAKAGFWTLTLGSVGVVYGDIGTSPLYAFREAVAAVSGGAPPTREGVLGVLSLILWALTLVVTLKYVVILLRADNNGEGGTLTLVALAQRAVGRRAWLILLLGPRARACSTATR
jgi:KUP system potassium uptake protein